MVIKLKILLVLLILSLNGFSQKDTSKICFTYNTAKLIAVDLVKGDSAIAELKVINKMVWQLNEKINAQDSLVTLYVVKEQNYVSQIDNYDQISNKHKTITTGLESDVITLTRKNNRLKKGIKLVSGGFVVSVLIIITLVTIK